MKVNFKDENLNFPKVWREFDAILRYQFLDVDDFGEIAAISFSIANHQLDQTGSKLARPKFAFKHGLHLSKQRCPTARAAFPDVCVMTCHHAMTCHDVMI